MYLHRCARASLLCIALSAIQARTIEANVVSDKGVPIPDAKVSFYALTGTTDRTTPRSGGALDQTGKISIDLPDQTEWKVCASAPPEAKLLDSCTWESDLPGASEVTINASRVKPGAVKASTTLVLQPAISLQIQIDDPKSLLTPGVLDASSGKETTSAPVRAVKVGVRTPKGHFYPAIPTQVTKTSIKYEVWVPEGVQMSVSVSGFNVSVFDSQSRPSSQSNDRFVSSQADATKIRVFTAGQPPSRPSDSRQ